MRKRAFGVCVGLICLVLIPSLSAAPKRDTSIDSLRVQSPSISTENTGPLIPAEVIPQLEEIRTRPAQLTAVLGGSVVPLEGLYFVTADNETPRTAPLVIVGHNLLCVRENEAYLLLGKVNRRGEITWADVGVHLHTVSEARGYGEMLGRFFSRQGAVRRKYFLKLENADTSFAEIEEAASWVQSQLVVEMRKLQSVQSPAQASEGMTQVGALIQLMGNSKVETLQQTGTLLKKSDTLMTLLGLVLAEAENQGTKHIGASPQIFLKAAQGDKSALLELSKLAESHLPNLHAAGVASFAQFEGALAGHLNELKGHPAVQSVLDKLPENWRKVLNSKLQDWLSLEFIKDNVGGVVNEVLARCVLFFVTGGKK